jgi:hypothetical protein
MCEGAELGKQNPASGPLTRQQRSGASASTLIKALSCGNMFAGWCPGRAHKASATISDLRKRPPVEIEWRYMLPSK